MALRFLLVGLVASLGSDLPDRDSLARAFRAGQSWVMERAETVAGMFVVDRADSAVESAREPSRAPEDFFPRGDSASIEIVDAGDAGPAVEVEVADSGDVAFGVVVDEMAGAVASEGVEAPAVVAVEQGVPASGAFAGLAYELNRLSDGVGDGWMVAEDAPIEVADAEATPGPAAEEIALDMEPRGERVGTAVRLTGQALQAWFSVLEQRGPIRVTGR
jgi:hypothetical protein